MSAPERFMPAFFDRNRQHPPHHAASYQPPPQPPRPLSPGQSDPLYYGPSADRRATLNPFADHLHDDSAPLAATNFLDNILNPAGYDHNSFLPYSYRTSTILDGMPPNTRAHAQASSRPARLPNGYVDLTSTPDSPPQRRKRDSPSPGPSAKRQKRDNGSSREQAKAEPATIEEVDLTDDKAPVQNILQKQREDAIKAQIPQEEKATTFNTFTCVICMDTPTDLTATSCGHLFCHTCLMEALIAGENRAAPGEQKRSQCPVCRKFINRRKETDIIPLLLKKGFATQPKKKVQVAATVSKVQ